MECPSCQGANPEGAKFCIEEMIRSLLDANLVVRENSHWRATREIATIGIPDTLAGVFTARLDRLSEDSNRVAEIASVIGREFQADTLGEIYTNIEVVDRALADLQQRELIREQSVAPQRLYIYKHALTQEEAYASLLLSSHRELHLHAGECLERCNP